jgi:2'-5' RNA ligase
VRLFVGVRVSLATANALARAVETLSRRARDSGADLRWVPPASYHVTLKFLGSTRAEAIDAVVDALGRACAGTPGHAFKTGRLGAFPSLERASVLWPGIDEPSGALGRLATAGETALVALGYPAENRAFHPHVTLARAKETRALGGLVLPVAEQMFGESRVEAVTLFESETKPTGSVYKEISRIDFKQVPIPTPADAERQTRALELVAQHGLEDTDDGWPRGQH